MMCLCIFDLGRVVGTDHLIAPGTSGRVAEMVVSDLKPALTRGD